ncbi:transcriptional regulator [Azorhizobium oxalatiphilum]|uniref:Transcriptional regulator n=1 Tax=Azorhizobium oxalatiphilum TaxID=980631 RepID=A0A917FGJ5_9HYPH|nr:LysR substrate-binding domain-containing protein [Azorhizobium oxalatiphilum]GGF77323.1 transcriptional regulator [Azorhizobium oxalatiphilum]
MVRRTEDDDDDYVSSAVSKGDGGTRLNAVQLDIFHAVVATGSVTAASRRLNLSQPAVSRRLADLERSLGFALFLREGKRLIITPEGTAFHDELTVSYVGLERLAKVARDIRELRRGHLRVAAIPAMCFGPVPQAIARFMQEHPQTKITFEVHASARILDGLAAGLFDVGVTQMPAAFSSLTVEYTYYAPCLCVMPVGHPLSAKSAVTLQDLASYPLISLPHDTEVGHALMRRFEAFGQVTPRAEALTSMAACALVAAGAGVTLCDPFTASSFGEGRLITRPFQPAIDFSFRVLRPERRVASRPVQALVDTINAHLGADSRVHR